jgi:AraC-like DNA-binding protein
MITITGTEIDLPLLIEAAAVRSPGAERLAWHSHAGVQLVFLITGATTYELAAGRTLVLPGGHFLAVPAHTRHRGLNNMRMPSEVASLTFNLRPGGKSPALPFTRAELNWMESCFEASGARVYPFGPAVKLTIPYLKAEITAWNGSQTTLDRKARLRMLVCACILEAAREIALNPVERPNEIVVAAVEYLRAHLDEPLSVAALTKHLGFSRARVFDLFAKETGLAPHHYLVRLRLEKATELLRNTRKSITEIAFATGFASGQHLSRVFRTYRGETPSQCRESVNGRARAASKPPSRDKTSTCAQQPE